VALIRTYVDSGVLIYAAKGKHPSAALALPFVTDPRREYVTSDYVHLELLPKSKFNKAVAETAFLEAFLAANVLCVPPSTQLMNLAMSEASKCGIAALDALHVAAAVFAGAQELITSEGVNKPMHRTQLVKIVSIFEGVPTPPVSLAKKFCRKLHGLASYIERHTS
jgi:predicted nucleic acid-binding protein